MVGSSQDRVLQNGADAYGFFAAQMALRQDESLRIAYLDRDGRLIRVTDHEDAAADAVDLPIRAILRDALAWDAAALVLAHNHPSGDPTPSGADIDATLQLAEAARRVGIYVLDHLVFASGGCRSFRALGLL